MFLGSWWKKGNFPSKKHEIRYNYSICLYLDAYWAIFSDTQCTLCIVFASCDVFCNCTVSLLVISGSSLHSSNTLARPSNTCNGRLAKLVASNKTQFNTLMLLSEHLIWGMPWISSANNNAIKRIEKMHVMYRYLSLFQQRLSNDTMEHVLRSESASVRSSGRRRIMGCRFNAEDMGQKEQKNILVGT